MIRKLMCRLPLVGNRLPSLSMIISSSQRKYLLAWFRSRRKDYLLDHPVPWITFDATSYLKANLRPGIHVFEYGSGASTLFWTLYHAQCVSVESDPEWYDRVSKRLDAASAVDLRLIPPDPSHPDARDLATRDPADPHGYWTDWVGFESHTFRNYASQIDTFPDGYFDVVMVDGHARPSCLMHSHKKVKRGGMLILDNADVAIYLARTTAYLEKFERHSFYGIAPIHGVMSQTDVYIAL